MKRYVTIDFLRGFAIFGVVFVHIFSDLFNQDAIFNDLDNTPLSFIIILFVIVYLGTWGGMFVMISATGNMFSMYANYDRGKTVKQVMMKQVVGGVILLFFSLLVEGVLQRYAFLGTLVPAWGPPDPSRIIWHAYAMTPVHCLSVCMIINGLVQGILSRKGGHKKFKRNIIVYIVLIVLVLVATQPIWDFAKDLIPGYPNENYSVVEDGVGYDLQYPLMGWPWWQYITHFLLLIVAGSNTPIFPFLAVSFIGNIVGLLLIKKKQNSDICKKGMLVGLLIIVIGVLIGLINGAGFDEFLPLTNSFENITGVSGGLNWLWFPWFSFQTGGQVIALFFMIRLIEFRDKSEALAKKTKFIRRFGIPAFTTYAFHRFWALPPTMFLSWISGIPYMLDDKTLSFGFTMVNILLVMLFIHLIFILWEKIGYIGSLEWGMGTIAGLLMPKMPKAKSNLVGGKEVSMDESRKKVPWYLVGKINNHAIFYNVEWIDKSPPEEEIVQQKKESRLSMKLAIIGILVFPVAILSLIIGRKARISEGKNKYNNIGIVVSAVALAVGIALIMVTSTMTLGALGISF